MKTIALSMILSLAVIVCEQQTLFAPHIVTFDGLKAANSLTNCRCNHRRIVNRSVPLAGSGDGVISAATEFVKNDVWVVDTGDGLTGSRYEEIASSQKNDWIIAGNPSLEAKDLDALSPGNGTSAIDPGDCTDIVDPGLDNLHNNGAFLPWHRGYIYR
jgi:hypothetical protein